MSKSSHDAGCAARRSGRCDCAAGRARRVLKAARNTLKRRTCEIIEVPRGTLGKVDWLSMKLTGRVR